MRITTANANKIPAKRNIGIEFSPVIGFVVAFVVVTGLIISVLVGFVSDGFVSVGSGFVGSVFQVLSKH